MKILVVDDDRSLRDALRRALSLGGYEVKVAEGGQHGLTQIAAARPDAVVLDVGMPDIDGLRQPRSRSHAHGPRRRRGPHRRPRRGRRRLPRQGHGLVTCYRFHAVDVVLGLACAIPWIAGGWLGYRFIARRARLS